MGEWEESKAVMETIKNRVEVVERTKEKGTKQTKEETEIKMDPELRARMLKSYHQQNMERAMQRKAKAEEAAGKKELPSIRPLFTAESDPQRLARPTAASERRERAKE